jgi:hypothetical protein
MIEFRWIVTETYVAIKTSLRITRNFGCKSILVLIKFNLLVSFKFFGNRYKFLCLNMSSDFENANKELFISHRNDESDGPNPKLSETVVKNNQGVSSLEGAVGCPISQFDVADSKDSAHGIINQSHSKLMPALLLDAFKSNPEITSAKFAIGLSHPSSRFQFHGQIALPSLSKIVLVIPPETSESSKICPLPKEFKRLLYFLKEIQYTQLSSIEIICSIEQAASIPLSSALIPSYEYEDYSPLNELVTRNRETLLSIALGPAHNQIQLGLNPKQCNAMCEPHNYPKLDSFQGFPNFPILSSWSAMLRPQRHLTKLSLAFLDLDIWTDIQMAIENSSEVLTSVNLKIFGAEQSTVDLRIFKSCICLTDLTLRYFGVDVVGWEALPGGIKTLALGGIISLEDVEKAIGALLLLEEVSVEIKRIYSRDADG